MSLFLDGLFTYLDMNFRKLKLIIQFQFQIDY